MAIITTLVFTAAVLFGRHSLADTPTTSTLAACSELFKAYPKRTIFDPLGPDSLETLGNVSYYAESITGYWNARNTDNRPACTFLPSSASDTSFVVKTLLKYPSANFALKGGGHNPNVGWSSVNEGILIAFRPNSQYAIPSADGSTIDVGAGCKFEDVYEVLTALKKTVVGGRLGDIGVNGFLLGGGLSYLSAQYGFAADNVVNAEVVLANGTITNANATSNPDLFFALKGGGNQYAIVTKWTLKTYDSGTDGLVWGGVRTYTGDKHEAVFSAVSNFTAQNRDPKAAMIPTFNFAGLLVLDLPVIIVFLFYDASSPATGVFDALDAIPALTDSTEAQTMYELTQEIFAGDYQGLRFQIRETTFPNMELDKMTSFLTQAYDLIDDGIQPSNVAELVDFHFLTFTPQPISTLIAQASQNAGDNALGLDPDNGDRVFVENSLAWGSPLCDEDCPAYFSQLVTATHELHVQNYSGNYPTSYKSGDLEYISYNPIFMNDAMYNQQPLQSYGDATYQRLKAVHQAYDPTNFFGTRQGGWNFTT